MTRPMLASGLVLLGLCAAGGFGEDEKPAAPSKRRPLVVMKQTEIEGRVFLLGDKEGEERALQDVVVEVFTEDGNKKLFKTKTDKEGRYTLPNMQEGLYRLKIGLLQLDLRVDAPQTGSENKTPIPKTIIVFIPKEMEAVISE